MRNFKEEHDEASKNTVEIVFGDKENFDTSKYHLERLLIGMLNPEEKECPVLRHVVEEKLLDLLDIKDSSGGYTSNMALNLAHERSRALGETLGLQRKRFQAFNAWLKSDEFTSSDARTFLKNVKKLNFSKQKEIVTSIVNNVFPEKTK